MVRVIHIFLGGSIAPIIFGFNEAGEPFKTIAAVIRWGLMWNPTLAFADGLTAILVEQIRNPNGDTYATFGIQDSGANLIAFGVQFVFFSVMILLIENKFYINKVGRAIRMSTEYLQIQGNDIESVKDVPDQDVVQEEQRVSETTSKDLEVRTYLLNKIYKTGKTTKHAVKDISFGISFGE